MRKQSIENTSRIAQIDYCKLREQTIEDSFRMRKQTIENTFRIVQIYTIENTFKIPQIDFSLTT